MPGPVLVARAPHTAACSRLSSTGGNSAVKLLRGKCLRTSSRRHAANNLDGPTNADMEAAVREDRIISKKESNVRTVLGLATSVLSAANVYSQGLGAMSPITVVFTTALPLLILSSGIFKLCGCSVRLHWAVDGVHLGSTKCPASYEDFLKGKRRQYLGLMAACAVFAAVLTVALYTLTGTATDLPALLLSVGEGALLFLAVLFGASYFHNRDTLYNLGL